MSILELSEWHPSLFAKWESNGRRLYTPLSSRKGYTIHHSAGGDGRGGLGYAKEVGNWHFSKWSRPGGYNFFIPEDGSILEMCGWNYIGAHAPGCNTNSIGVCFQGTFNNGLPNETQLESFAWLLNKHGVPKNQQGHRDCSSTGCPGDALYRELPLSLSKGAQAPKASKPKKGSSSQPTSNKWTESVVDNLPLVSKEHNSKGAHARRAQSLLAANGHPPANTFASNGKPDGNFGPGSDSATKSFQKSKRLGVDGIVGPNTWTALLGG